MYYSRIKATHSRLFSATHYPYDSTQDPWLLQIHIFFCDLHVKSDCLTSLQIFADPNLKSNTEKNPLNLQMFSHE